MGVLRLGFTHEDIRARKLVKEVRAAVTDGTLAFGKVERTETGYRATIGVEVDAGSIRGGEAAHQHTFRQPDPMVKQWHCGCGAVWMGGGRR